MTTFLPIFLDLKNKPVLVIGGGLVALEKLEKIVPTDADITVIARDFKAETLRKIQVHALRWERRDVEASDIEGKFFVVSAVNDPEEHARIAHIARRKKVLINAVDAPSASDCFFAAQVERGPLQLAISTQGLFPGVARSLRLWLEDLLPKEITREFEDLVQLRAAIRGRIPDTVQRMQALREQLAIWNKQSIPATQESMS
jgi:siroheme synthase-like protein